MQSWQIKALELEASALGQLDEFIAHHKLGVFVAVIYLALALLAGFIALVFHDQRKKPSQRRTHVPPIVFVEIQAPPPWPPPPDTFDPFPPPPHFTHEDYDEFDRD